MPSETKPYLGKTDVTKMPLWELDSKTEWSLKKIALIKNYSVFPVMERKGATDFIRRTPLFESMCLIREYLLAEAEEKEEK